MIGICAQPTAGADVERTSHPASVERRLHLQGLRGTARLPARGLKQWQGVTSTGSVLEAGGEGEGGDFNYSLRPLTRKAQPHPDLLEWVIEWYADERDPPWRPVSKQARQLAIETTGKNPVGNEKL
jgi:hypothetical protein